jgi:hypothetical protein
MKTETSTLGTGGTLPKVSRVLSARFDAKKDYLTIELVVAADSGATLRPNWQLIRLRHRASLQAPFKLWSERKEIQKDAAIRARLIFAKPNIPRDLSAAMLVIPMAGASAALSLPLKGAGR